MVKNESASFNFWQERINHLVDLTLHRKINAMNSAKATIAQTRTETSSNFLKNKHSLT